MAFDSLLYSLKVWITNAAIAPLLMLVITICVERTNQPIYNENIGELFGAYLIFVVIELILSLITCVVFFIAVMISIIYIHNLLVRDCAIFIVGTLLTLGTFLAYFPSTEILNYNDGCGNALLVSFLCVGGGTWYYKLGQRQYYIEETKTED